MSGILIDISQRKETEAKLLESLGLYRQIYECSLIGIVVADPEGRVEQVNPAVQRLLGYAEMKLRDMDLMSLFNVDHNGPYFSEYQRLLAGQIAGFVMEDAYRHQDGHEIPMRKIVSRMPPTSEAPGKILVLVRDLTEEKNLEDQLAANLFLRDLALAGAELGTWDTDLVSEVTHYDQRYCDMLGYRAEELALRMATWGGLIHPDDVASVTEAMQAHLKGESRLYQSEHRLRHKAGHWVWVLVRGKVLFDAQGCPLRATGTICDISERKRSADEIMKLMLRLESMISGDGPVYGDRGSTPAEISAKSMPLSPRGRQIVSLVAAGFSSAEIAQKLSISKATVETHRRNLMRKLGLRNTAELIRYGLQNNLAR